METQSDQKIHTVTDAETIDSETQEDLEKLPDDASMQDDNTTAINDENDEELTSNNEMIADLLTKIKAMVKNIREENFEKTILIDEWQIHNDLFDLAEKHEETLTDEDLSVVRKGLQRFFSVVYDIPSYTMLSTDSAYAKTIFYKYSNLINFTTVQNYLKNVEMPDHLKLLCSTCITKILKTMRESCIHTILRFNDDERPTNYIELLSLLLNHVNTDLKSSNLSIDSLMANVSFTRWSILQFIMNYSDKTILVQDLIEAGCSEFVTEWLRTINKAARVNSDLNGQLIVIMYNITRHDEGSVQLNALNAADEIKIVHSNNNPYPNILCFMALILLSTSEQIKNNHKHINNSLDKILKTVYDASRYDYYSDGAHISEPLIVLVKLFNNDRSFDYIMEHAQVELYTSTTVEFFINQLIKYHSSVTDEDSLKQTTCAAFVNILWRASFQDKYKEILKNTGTDFQELIQNFTKEPDENIARNQYVSKHIENIQKAAKGLLFNMNAAPHPTTKQDNEVALHSTTMGQTLYPEKPIEQWSKNDISQWFQYSGIRTELRDLCRFEDGYELLNYAKIFLDTEKLQYQMYTAEFSRRSGITSSKNPLLLHEFTKFSNALRKLEKFNR